MKIAFVGNFLHKKRGSQGTIAMVAPYLQKKGYDSFMTSSVNNKLLRQLDIAWQLLTKHFDIVHIDAYSFKGFFMAVLATRIARFKQKPIIINVHGGRFLEFLAAKKALTTKLLKQATKVLSPSSFITEGLQKSGINCVYFPNPVQLDRFSYKERKPSGSPKLLWVRAFTEIYQPELAIETLNLLKHKYPGIKLTMIGPDLGGLDAAIKNVERLGLSSSIDLVGSVPFEALPAYYQSHDVYLNTTQFESFGFALFEAAASGIPIVSTSVGEIPYLWENGKNILLMAAKPTAFSAAIEQLLENPAMSKQLAKEARNNAAKFDASVILDKWLNLFQEMKVKKDEAEVVTI